MSPAETRTTTYSPDTGTVTVRDVETDGEFYRVRVPISSTATARDGQAFSRERLEGFREQIQRRQVPVFIDHGKNDSTGNRYSALGKLGFLDEPELVTREGATELDADLAILDPDDLASDGDVGPVTEALRYVRRQAEAGMLTTSVGWDEDVGDRDIPGDAELLELSVVGLPADPRAGQASSDVPQAVRSGVEALPDRSEPTASTGADRWQEQPPSEAERAADTLKRLHSYREKNTPGPDAPPWRRGDEHPMSATLAELCRLFGADGGDPDVDDVRERLETLRGTTAEAQRQRTDVLARLSTVRDHREQHPRGGQRRSSRVDRGTDPVVEAVDDLRELLTESEQAGRSEPFGFAGAIGRERDGHRAAPVEDATLDELAAEVADALGRRHSPTARKLCGRLNTRGGQTRDAVFAVRRDRPDLDQTLGDIAALRRAVDDDETDRALDRLRRGLIGGVNRGGDR